MTLHSSTYELPVATLYVTYKVQSAVDERLDAQIEDAVGRGRSGSGFCFLTGERDMVFERVRLTKVREIQDNLSALDVHVNVRPR
jgi:HrpA-like RNA helicase